MEGGTTMIKGGEKALPSQYINAPSMRFSGGYQLFSGTTRGTTDWL